MKTTQKLIDEDYERESLKDQIYLEEQEMEEYWWYLYEKDNYAEIQGEINEKTTGNVEVEPSEI